MYAIKTGHTGSLIYLILVIGKSLTETSMISVLKVVNDLQLCHFQVVVCKNERGNLK